MLQSPTISNEALVLLRLLRMALGNESHFCRDKGCEQFPVNTDWKKVIHLSYEHKVSALAVDGLKSSGFNLARVLDKKRNDSLLNLANQWISDIDNTEKSFDYYVNVLQALTKIFVSNGLKPIILKGYGVGLNYPIPSHRGAGDIDIVLFDKNGKLAADKGDEILQRIAIKEDDTSSYHTNYSFKGIGIENHSELTRIIKDTAPERFIVKWLNDNISLQSNKVGFAVVPNYTFNAVFLIRHIYRHFYWRGFDMRQICDWMLFVKAHHSEIDWNMVNDVLVHSEMKLFYDALNGALAKYMLMDISCLPDFNFDTYFVDNIMYDAFNQPTRGGSLTNRVMYYYKDRWKIRYRNGYGWITAMILSPFAHLSHILNHHILRR